MADRDFEYSELKRADAQKTITQCEAWAYQIDQLVQSGVSVIIHCNQGRTRTPLVTAAYLWLYHSEFCDCKIQDVAEEVKRQIESDRPNIKGVFGEDGTKMINLLDYATETREAWGLDSKG